MDTPTNFVQIIILFEDAFEYGDGAKFWGLLRQTPNYPV
jgi:hypothetical protein